MRGLLAALKGWRKRSSLTPPTQSPPSAHEYIPEDLQRLRFRYGFLAYGKSKGPKGDSTWRALAKTWGEASIGPLTLRTHPEAELRIERIDAETEIAIIGPVFSTNGSPLDLAALAADPPNALRTMSGRFALIVTTGKTASVFHDAFGARTIYYLKDRGTLVFASHAGLIGRAFGIPKNEEMERFIKTPEYAKRKVKYLPGDMTMYKSVFALIPNNSLEFPSMETKRYWPAHAVLPCTFDDFFREIDALYMSTIGFLGDRHLPIFGITGGIDSRAIYAAWRQRGVKFRGVTWYGSYLKDHEVPTVKAIVAYLGQPHDTISFTGDHDVAIAKIAQENAGAFRGLSRLAAEMHSLYAQYPSSVFVSGWSGEIVRGFYNLRERPMEGPSSREMARLYGARKDGWYLSVVCSAFDGFRERGNYRDINRHDVDINDIFYWEHRMGMWAAAMLNEIDPACSSLIGINSRAVYEAAFGLPTDERLTKDLLRSVVRRYDENLAEIAVH